MPGADWYPNARLNYAEHVFRHARADAPALIARHGPGWRVRGVDDPAATPVFFASDTSAVAIQLV